MFDWKGVGGWFESITTILGILFLAWVVVDFVFSPPSGKSYSVSSCDHVDC
jgi:hypothetical protein